MSDTTSTFPKAARYTVTTGPKTSPPPETDDVPASRVPETAMTLSLSAPHSVAELNTHRPSLLFSPAPRAVLCLWGSVCVTPTPLPLLLFMVLDAVDMLLCVSMTHRFFPWRSGKGVHMLPLSVSVTTLSALTTCLQ